ncbi:Kinase [Mycena kentingensis (nom. inval.)]|nr:Kinase [Mycena kentingensis (nom. inval.)]
MGSVDDTTIQSSPHSTDAGYVTERSRPRPLDIRRNAARALTLPASSSMSSLNHHFSRPLSARSSSPSSSSSSGAPSSSPDRAATHMLNAGIGRKVAATLQLFKETKDGSGGSASRAGSSKRPEDVAEAKFEFLKRSEWPDREAAAVRRQKSATALRRVRTRESAVYDEAASRSPSRESVLNDIVSWRDDISTSPEKTRGRARQRPTDEALTFFLASSPLPDRILLPHRLRDRIPAVYRDISGKTLVPGILARRPSRPSPLHVHSPNFRPASTFLYHRRTVLTKTSTTSAGASNSFSTIPSTHLPRRPPIIHELTQKPKYHGLLDLDADLTDQLPHIPLRPFRNQVGGHSAIYRFTKQAVCKPLVSRENLFYESVEREAPPLLGYIPRYLGVMLVTYRRVPKAPTSLSSVHNASRCIRPSADDVDAEGAVPGDTDTDSAEMPEVALDHNRHMIPEWLLRGRRRSFSQSNATAPFVDRRAHWSNSAASSPDLNVPAPVSIPRSRPSPLTRYPPFMTSDMDAPTPVNSPSQSTRAFPPKLVETPVSSPFLSQEMPNRPSLASFVSSPPPQSPWFGGIGSTTVNTKLKDHVFSTVLRRFRRRTGGRLAAGNRTDDDGDAADVETDQADYRPSARRTASGRIRPLISQVDRLQTEEIAPPIRRVHSENMIGSPAKLEALQMEQHRSKNMIHVFDSFHDLDLSPSISRRRSRSRSLDFAPSPPPPPTQSISFNQTLDNDPSVTRQNHFILMEDLTGRLKHPCVMDLKMGTRQYGIDATLVKKKSQRKKCDRTTSRSLGVRVCGMQVWNHVTQSYVSQDKYMGRDLRPEGFPSTLASFLHDGERLLVYHIPILLQKLYGLARIIHRLKGYRFYGCSLLLIYDGDRELQDQLRSSTSETPSSVSKRGESLERPSPQSAERPSLRRTHSEDILVGPLTKRGRRRRGEINLRIVDFAHTTTGHDWLPYSDVEDRPTESIQTQGYQADVDPETGFVYARFPPHYPEEADRGFLFGLRSLASTLEQIWNNERLRRIKSSRDGEVRLPPLSTDGKEIFDVIFGTPDEDPGMVST